MIQNEDRLENRTILYQMVALYDYASQGPEDLEFNEGDTIDILGEGKALQVNLLDIFTWNVLMLLSSIFRVSLPLNVSACS